MQSAGSLKKAARKDSLYALSVLASVLIWSTSFVGTKIAYASFPPLTLGAARFLLATAVLGVLLLAQKQRARPGLKDLGWMALSGLLGITIYFALQNIALKMLSASDAVLIVACYPAITALLEFAFYRTKISWVKILGIALAICGVWWLSRSEAGDAGSKKMLGTLLLVLTGVAWALYNFVTGKVVKKYPMVTVSFWQTAAGTIAFLPLALMETRQWQAPTPGAWLMLAYLGVFCSVVAFLAYNFGLKKLSASTAVAMLNLVPVFGVVFSVLLLKEHVNAAQLGGGAVVITGVLLSMREVRSKQPAQDQAAQV